MNLQGDWKHIIKLLQPNETPICIYEGMNKFAVYKKTLEKNIIFVDVVFVEKETNRIFT